MDPARRFSTSIDDDGISFSHYPFPPASVSSARKLGFDAIASIDSASAPPEIRTKAGEILFVTAEQKETLVAAADHYRLSVIRYQDVWDMLLDPFLDTEFTPEEQERTIERLLENNISRAETLAIRTKVAAPMEAYNLTSGLWDWVHLGLWDLFQAHLGYLSGLRYRLSEADFRQFYWWAQEIALRGKPIL